MCICSLAIYKFRIWQPLLCLRSNRGRRRRVVTYVTTLKDFTGSSEVKLHIMEDEQLFSDMEFKQEFENGSLKIHKLRDGLQCTLNVSLNDSKEDEEAFHVLPDLDEINKRAKEADRCFGEIMLQTMENKQLPQTLYQLLQEQKSEAEAILKDYDNIILQLNSTLSSKDKEYREKIEAQSIQHQIIRQRIEEIISELNRVGKEEISAMRTAIVDHSKYVSDSLWTENGNIHGETGADKVFNSYLWRNSSELLTTKQMEDAFLIQHNDTFQLRRKLLSEICKLRNELEKEKLNYNLKKQVFEQEIFFLSEKYRSGLPTLSKMRRKCIMLHDLKNDLCNELKPINALVERERKINEKQRIQIQPSELEIRYAREEKSSRFLKVSEERKATTYGLYSEILNSTEFIFKNILTFPWKAQNLIPHTTTEFQQKDWECFLSTILEDSTIDEILRIMEEYSIEWKTRVGLAELQKSLVLQSTNYNHFLKLYNKYQHF